MLGIWTPHLHTCGNNPESIKAPGAAPCRQQPLLNLAAQSSLRLVKLYTRKQSRSSHNTHRQTLSLVSHPQNPACRSLRGGVLCWATLPLDSWPLWCWQHGFALQQLSLVVIWCAWLQRVVGFKSPYRYTYNVSWTTLITAAGICCSTVDNR